MGFLRKFLNLPDDGSAPTGQATLPSGNSIILLFKMLPDLNRGIISLRQLLQDPNIHFQRLEGQEAGIFQMIGHEVQVTGIDHTLSREVQNRTIGASNLPKSIKDQLQNHRAHLICTYTGENDSPLQQMLTLYQVAAAFGPLDLLGVLDEVAHVAHPTRIVKEVALGVDRHLLKKEIPTAFWTSLMKVQRPDGLVWYATRGFERFKCPNFAVLAQDGQAQDVLEVFTLLLKAVVFEKAVFQVGESTHLEGTDVLFRELYEYEEDLQGPGSVLVVEIEDAS